MNDNQKITYRNGFKAIKALNKVAADKRVAEIEGAGMDEGRVFIHLVRGYKFGGGYDTHSHSVGSCQEIRDAMKLVEAE